MIVRVRWLAAVALLGGCAYYNGLYNANRLVKEAERASRDGRIGEARSLWTRAAIKAESVAVRCPASRYRDDAWLVWGRALREAGIDVIVDGVSLVSNYRASFNSEIRRHGMDGLIQRLRAMSRKEGQ